MNQRNVDALASVVLEVNSQTLLDDHVEFAASLAARGVLVPSTLTDEQAEQVVDVSATVAYPYEDPYMGIATSGSDFRAELERIAKGEA